MRRALGLLALPLLFGTLAACGDDAPSSGAAPSKAPSFTFGSKLQAPARTAYHGSDESPDPQDGRVDLTLDGGAKVVMWIDPHDFRTVFAQHSDPKDARSWTEPERLFRSGDGCLFVYGATDGTTVAATLGCYVQDAFIQQAPDEAQALVTTDLQKWHRKAYSELYGKPKVADGKVDWEESDLAWSPGKGFTD